jgi:hypothetical protein
MFAVCAMHGPSDLHARTRQIRDDGTQPARSARRLPSPHAVAAGRRHQAAVTQQSTGRAGGQRGEAGSLRWVQAKKNVESGRVFQAREAAARLQRQAEWQQEEMRGLQQQVQELQEDLAAARHQAATPAGGGPADRELETLRFVHSEVQGELERARIALREARSRVGELSNQLVASQVACPPLLCCLPADWLLAAGCWLLAAGCRLQPAGAVPSCWRSL